MKLKTLSFLLGLSILLFPFSGSAQDEAPAEGDTAATPDEGDAAPAEADAPAEPTEEPETAQDAEQEAAPEPQPEPELSAVAAETGDPAESTGDADANAEADAGWQPTLGTDDEDGGGASAPPSDDGDHDGLRYDMETGRWVADVEPLPWRNSLFVWNNAVTANTFLPNGQLTYNPTYVQTFSLRPRWYLSQSVSLRLRQDLNWELTQPDLNNDQVTLGDLSVSIFDTGVWTMPGDVIMGLGVAAFAPVSESSQNCTLIAGLQGNVSLTKVFPSVLTGLTMQAFGGFRGNFHAQDTCDLQGDNPYPGAPLTPGNWNHTGGVSNAIISGQAGAVIALAPIPELSFSTAYQSQWNLGRGYGDFEVPCDGCPGGSEVVSDTGTHERALVFWSASATWLTNEWVNVSLTYSSFNFARDPSGDVYNPFYNNQSTFTLQGVFILDRVYQGVEGMLEADDVEEDPAATARNDEEENDSDDARAANEASRRAAQ